jgi:epoxyqueuosine reductase
VAETLARELKRYALQQLSFQLVGITDVAPLEGARRLARWVKEGRHGEMEYMATTAHLRGRPEALLPGARSVVCVAMSYHDTQEEPETAPRGDRVVVARYARRKDYHAVIRKRVVRLGRFLAERRPGSRWRAAVDTAPLLEKELAQRAGLGWIGKNTCLINRRLGSELLLGELLTDVELPLDDPETDHCGTCTACLQACPTGAFPAPRSLDARRCVSYLTIEHRSEIPVGLSRRLGAHLAGCDICQAVCPWNRRAEPSCAAPLRPRTHLVSLRLLVVEALDAGGWRELSAGSPLRRIDFDRFRRNRAAVRANLREAATPGVERQPTIASSPPRSSPQSPLDNGEDKD